MLSNGFGQATYTWNGTLATGSTPWTTTSNWSPGTNFPGNTSGIYDTATFLSTSNPTGTVTITAPTNLYLNAINFNQMVTTAGDNFVISGGTINFGGTNPTITLATSGITEVINSSIAVGSSGLTLSSPAGATTLTLGGGATLTGNLVIANAMRVNFDNGAFNGAGQIQVQATARLSNSNAAPTSGFGTVANAIFLNSNNTAFTAGIFNGSSVFYTYGSFVTSIGATSSTGSTSPLTFSGVISGNSDVGCCQHHCHWRRRRRGSRSRFGRHSRGRQRV